MVRCRVSMRPDYAIRGVLGERIPASARCLVSAAEPLGARWWTGTCRQGSGAHFCTAVAEGGEPRSNARREQFLTPRMVGGHEDPLTGHVQQILPARRMGQVD